MSLADYWALFGTLYLIFLTYKDYTNNMNVDDRYNYLMFGLSISLYSHFKNRFIYILAIIIILSILYIYIKKFKLIGEADINTISWIFLGYAIISPYKLLGWFFFFTICALFYTIMKKYVFKIDRATPFYGVLLICFATSNFLMGVY